MNQAVEIQIEEQVARRCLQIIEEKRKCYSKQASVLPKVDGWNLFTARAEAMVVVREAIKKEFGLKDEKR